MKPMRICLAILACVYSFSAFGARPLLCLIQPDSEAEIGSPVVGVVDAILVERGDKVKKGQVLARLRSHVDAASLRVAKTRAEADAEELFEQKFISAAALEKSRAETKVAEEKFAQAQKQLDVWKREVDLAKAQLQLRAIRSPFSGVIVERHASLGERIEDKSMFRVARLDLLRVEIVVPAALFGTITKGMVARVTPTLPNAAPLDAEIVLIDHFIDSASNTFRVRAALPNADGKIPPGSRCTVELLDAPLAVQNEAEKALAETGAVSRNKQ